MNQVSPADVGPEHVTHRLAEWAASLHWEDLPEPVVAAARRFLFDAVGCALGGLQQHDSRIMLKVLAEIAGPGPCAILGTDRRCDPVSASLASSLLIRVMDYNDIYWQQDPSHPSDLIPAALSLAERQDAPGRDLLLGIVIGYEIEQRFCEVSFPGIREAGWHHATLTAVAAPLVAGRMLGLDTERLQHAIGISGSRHCTTGSVTAGKLTMMKNTVDPLAVQSGVLAALLAEQGYTGPEHVLDGKEGLAHVLPTEWRWDILTAGLADLSAGRREDWRILRCGMKSFPTEALTHAPISAVLDLVREHDLQPEQIGQVQVRSLARAADILADPSKYDPRTKETADHSLPYCLAAAIVDRQVTPAQFTDDRIMDRRIREQLPKIKVAADPEIEAVFPRLQRVVVAIETTDGRRLEHRLDYPKGDPRNPMTDEEMAAKFAALASPICSPARLASIQRALGRVEEFASCRQLAGELAVDRLLLDGGGDS
jgi:2-methylcitrate dehydratase